MNYTGMTNKQLITALQDNIGLCEAIKADLEMLKTNKDYRVAAQIMIKDDHSKCYYKVTNDEFARIDVSNEREEQLKKDEQITKMFEDLKDGLIIYLENEVKRLKKEISLILEQIEKEINYTGIEQ
jgi:hypothetical protein